MAKSKGARIPITLEHRCEQGVYRYHTSKNRRNTTERLELKKYSPVTKKHDKFLLQVEGSFILPNKSFIKYMEKTNTEVINFDELNYKDTNILIKFLSEQGKILPRRVTGLSSKQQKKVTKLIKMARISALLPFVVGKN